MNFIDNENNPPLILVADDNTANLQLAVSILKRQNFEIAVANNGEEALEILKNVKPDLILLDIMMPGVDGYEVCEIMKNNPETENIPVIFLTALKKSESLVKGFEYGAVDYITKPFNKEELISRVKNHLELKFSKDKIISQKQKLTELNEEINALLRITAHDLKNPIQGIIGLLDIIKMMADSDNLDKDSIQDIINSATGSAEQANTIITDILDLNRINRGEVMKNTDNINLKELAGVLYQNNKFKALKKDISFMFSEFQDEIHIITDYDKLYRILDNLISNAVKFTESGKKIHFRCIVDSNSKKVLFEISDEGPGISEEDQKKLFKRYAKLTNNPTGDETSSGLGLSIVKEFSEMLGFNVTYKTQIGKGSTFILSIPLKS